MKKPETLNDIEAGYISAVGSFITIKDLKKMSVAYFLYALKKEMNPLKAWMKSLDLWDDKLDKPNEEFEKIKKELEK